jgi:hypothetical protein
MDLKQKFKYILPIFFVLWASVAFAEGWGEPVEAFLLDDEGNIVGVQTPISVNGDSVYSKDIDTAASDAGTFTGTITSLVDDLGTTFSSTGHSSPAGFTITYERPIDNTGIKFCAPPGKSFSNVKITLKDKAGTILDTIDYSTDSTAWPSNEYRWRRVAYCTMQVQFYTTNDIDLNWAIIEKSQSVHLPDKHVSRGNSSITALAGNDSYTGTWIRTSGYKQAIIDITTDEDSATDGLIVELSEDGVTSDHRHKFFILANDPDGHHYPSNLELNYMRVIYNNGASAQSIFNLKTTLFPEMVEEGHAHNIEGELLGDHPAPTVRAVLSAKTPAGPYINIDATNGGNLKGSLEEYDPSLIASPVPVRNPVFEVARGNITGLVSDSKFGAAVEGVQLTATDIWDRADAAATQQIWLAPTAARTHEILSTSDSDSYTGGAIAQGDGCREVRLWGLTGWGTAEVSEDVFMDGTDGTDTTGQYVIIHRMKCIDYASLGPNVGDITAVAAVDATITAQINAGVGQTQMAILGIPSTQTIYIPELYFHLHDFANPATAIVADCKILVAEDPENYPAIFTEKFIGGVVTTGSSNMHHPFKTFRKFTGPAIIKIQAVGTVADSTASAGFDYVLETN